jgi:hypothetical protein
MRTPPPEREGSEAIKWTIMDLLKEVQILLLSRIHPFTRLVAKSL